MLAKKKVYIMNQGVFDLFGYHNLVLPAIVDLTESQINFIKAEGYAVEEFSGNASPEYNTIPSVGFSSVTNKREYENIMKYEAATEEDIINFRKGIVHEEEDIPEEDLIDHDQNTNEPSLFEENPE